MLSFADSKYLDFPSLISGSMTLCTCTNRTLCIMYSIHNVQCHAISPPCMCLRHDCNNCRCCMITAAHFFIQLTGEFLTDAANGGFISTLRACFAAAFLWYPCACDLWLAKLVHVPYTRERGPTTEYRPTPHFGLNFLFYVRSINNLPNSCKN